MPIEYSDFARIADDLSDTADSEVYLRSAVNRYYYATLTAVRSAYSLKPSPTQGYNAAVTALRRQTRSTSSKRFQELRDLRVLADYHPDVTQPWERHAVTARRIHSQIVDEMRRRGHLPILDS